MVSEASQPAASAGWTAPPERMKAVDPHRNGLKPLFDVVSLAVVELTAQFLTSKGSQIATSIHEKLSLVELVFLLKPREEGRRGIRSAAAENVEFQIQYGWHGKQSVGDVRRRTGWRASRAGRSTERSGCAASGIGNRQRRVTLVRPSSCRRWSHCLLFSLQRKRLNVNSTVPTFAITPTRCCPAFARLLFHGPQSLSRTGLLDPISLKIAF